ncbi:hypothetical protein ACN28C_28630 [Plantactinospora sp. WMMC1484]|uniref:hypothetical protein n=1 Tax=Plantactinospora sp. WMMC1484 TaxID=3404122 RepID=UPI003BF4AE5D
MRQHRIAIQMTLESTPHGTDEQFEEFLDAVQEHLDGLDGEIQMAASLAERTVEFATSIEAPDFESAANSLLVHLRTALHAAECHTDDWPQYVATERNLRELQDA